MSDNDTEAPPAAVSPAAGASRVFSIADYGVKAPEALEPAALPFLTLEQLRESARNVRWVVKNVIPAESVGLIFGGSGTFKSFIALDLALHVAHGIDWLGRKTRKGKVLIVAAEGGAGLWKRIVAWHRKHRLQWAGIEVYVVPVAVDLGNEASRVSDAALAIGVQPDLVIVDTLAQTFAGEENNAGEVSKYLREIGLWFRASWQAAVVVVHHTGHNETERPRGSSALRANVDFMLGVFRDEREMLATVECHKQKDGDLFDPVSFSLAVEELSIDEDGDAITSLVASSVDSTQALEIMAHEAQRGRGGQRQLFIDLALDGMEEKKLRTIFYEAIEGSSDMKRKAYGRARQWAVDAGLIEVAQGIVIRLTKAF